MDSGYSGSQYWGKYSVRYRESRGWQPLDIILVVLLTLASALMAFTDLGNRSAPQTFWKPDKVGEGFVVDFGSARQVDRISLYEGPGAKGETNIEWSADGRTWSPYLKVEHKTNRVFTWKYEDKPVQARYMRFTVNRTGFRLYEAGFFAKGDPSPLLIAGIEPNGKAGATSEGGGAQVFDEQDLAPYRPDYRNSMYFDEIYHGRTAYEFVELIKPVYEWTHPPLGKIILAIGVKMFDMTPYGWRFMAGVVGTLMIPIFYAVARGMFKRTRYALFASLLMLFEGFHIVHSRSSNIDIIGVTFTIVMFYAMYKYGETAWRRGGFGRSFGWLALSGAAFGAAAAVKWNYMYGGAGLAVLLLFSLIRRYREGRWNGEEGYLRKLVLTLMACIVLFVAVPASIYSASYIPFFKANKQEFTLKNLWKNQKDIYVYHKGVKEVHPYSSKWYTWPLMLRPVYYYGGKDLPASEKQSIAAIGNPLVWWGGLAAMLTAIWLGLRRKDWIVISLLVAYLSFYVPWMVAPRSITFLYHFFPMVPIVILFLVWMMRWLEENLLHGKKWTLAILVAAFALCAWFYPVYTGITIDKTWMRLAIRWLPSWDF